MAEPMSDERYAKIRYRAEHHTLRPKHVFELLDEVERLSVELDDAHAAIAGSPEKGKRIASIVASATRLVRIERDDARAALARVTDDSMAGRIDAAMGESWTDHGEHGASPAAILAMLRALVSDQHDDQCEAEYVVGAARYTMCGCAIRAVAAGEQAEDAPELFPGTRDALDRLTIRKDDDAH